VKDLLKTVCLSDNINHSFNDQDNNQLKILQWNTEGLSWG